MRPIVVLFFVVACTAGEPVAERRDELLGGSPAPNESRVFLLDVRGTRGTICSAVLVSPRALLTAAHCVDPARLGAPLTIRAMNKATTAGLSLSDTTLVTGNHRHPMWDASNDESPYDLAVLVLSTPSTVTPAPMASSLPASVIGQPLEVVGYGRLTEGEPMSSGVRRSATIAVSAVDSATLSYGTDVLGLCVGDSGGPSFLNGQVVGIHSRTPATSGCGSGVDIRVDTYRAFIDGVLAANDPPVCSRDSRCAASCPMPDPDCACIADTHCNSSCPSDPDCTCAADGRCGASCGVRDADCCVRDGQCDAACGDSDSDCRCATNSACGASCGALDADCCRADGQCDASCGMADEDCRCVANGACGAGCGVTDPDCCGADGVCDAACGTDVDCAPAPECTSDATCQAGSVCDGGSCRPRSGCSSAVGSLSTAFVLLWRRRRSGLTVTATLTRERPGRTAA